MGFTGQQHKTGNLIWEAYSITSFQKLRKLVKIVEDQTYSWQSRLAWGVFVQDPLLFCHPLAYNFQKPPPLRHSSPPPHPQHTPHSIFLIPSKCLGFVVGNITPILDLFLSFPLLKLTHARPTLTSMENDSKPMLHWGRRGVCLCDRI